jgi:hypothetical protein
MEPITPFFMVAISSSKRVHLNGQFGFHQRHFVEAHLFFNSDICPVQPLGLGLVFLFQSQGTIGVAWEGVGKCKTSRKSTHGSREAPTNGTFGDP